MGMVAIPDCIREKWMSGLNSQLGCVGTLEYNFPHPQTHLQWHNPLWEPGGSTAQILPSYLQQNEGCG